MLCEVVDYLVEHPDITEKMAVPSWCLKAIKESWDREPAFGSVYGRFDVCFGGLDHPDPRLRIPKFYEFNSDTPTTLIEASTIQWLWLEQTGYVFDGLWLYKSQVGTTPLTTVPPLVVLFLMRGRV